MPYFEGKQMTGGYGNGPDIITSCSINVNRGEIVAILGPNGAGKSTAMKAMLGLLNLKSGSVLIDNEDIRIFNNKKYKNGIGTSISLGIQHLDTTVQGVMIIPADMPLISAEDLIKLEKEFIAHNCKKVVLPKYKYTIGNPVILPKSYFATLKNLKEDFGAKSQIKQSDIVEVDCDIGTVFDIDTSKALAKANILVKV